MGTVSLQVIEEEHIFIPLMGPISQCINENEQFRLGQNFRWKNKKQKHKSLQWVLHYAVLVHYALLVKYEIA